MKKTTYGMGAVVVGLTVLTLSAVSAPAAERPGFETYVVRSGDTLSKISGRVFGDVKRWREILKGNPQVTNANLIFPGDTLLVPVPATATAAPAGADESSGSIRTETVAAHAATIDQGAAGALSGSDSGMETVAAVPALPAERVRPVAVVSPALYRSAGSIADNLPVIAIVASQDDRILLGTNDAAIVNAPISPGTRLTVVRADRRIFHPVTGAYLGWLIRILGSAEVTCRGERTSTVALRSMNDAASVGDYLLPIDPNDALEQNALGNAQPGCIPPGACDGVIVAFNEDRGAIGEQDLAYIDRGSASGVTPGQQFTIYREIAPEGRITVGELQVLRVGVHTATALITTSAQEVEVGYLLRAH